MNLTSKFGNFIKDPKYFNIPNSILSKIEHKIHHDQQNPIHHLKNRIHHHFKENHASSFSFIDNLDNPFVSSTQNFDSLLFPKDHPGRSLTDSYYVNQDLLLRTHTSAHQSQTLKQGLESFLLTADVYRRDQIDSSHYPIFHQMEGVKLFSNNPILKSSNDGSDSETFQKEYSIDPQSNPIQSCHSPLKVLPVAEHLRTTLENLFKHLLSHDPNLKMRWITGYFPFTSPSWELEVLFNNEWLELCGCGIIQDSILKESGHPDKIGWAFGLGLERIAMKLHGIPDIRLFWSQDQRFLDQFKTSSHLVQFKPFSNYKDISFWTDDSFNDNDLNDIVRDVGSDLVESVVLFDTFKHPKTHRKSLCYRINYRSMERTLLNSEIDALQNRVRDQVTLKYNVELR